MLDDELERHDAEVSQLVASMTESIDRWLELKERTRKVRLSITSPVDERINDWAVYKEMKAEGAGLPEDQKTVMALPAPWPGWHGSGRT